MSFLLSILLLWSLITPAVVPVIPSGAIVENTYYVSGYLCMTGEQFHSLSDDVYGTHNVVVGDVRLPGVYNEYVITIVGYGGYDFFRVSLTMLNYQPGDKIIIVIAEVDGAAGTTVSGYYHVDTPIYKLPSGTYHVQVGYLSVKSVPAAYRINMG